MCGPKFCSMNYSWKVDEYNKQLRAGKERLFRVGRQAGLDQVVLLLFWSTPSDARFSH